jgi:hypothetical protein
LRRIVFTHIAFERETGIGFFENVPGWAGSPAEVALAVFLSVNDIFVPASTFGFRILPRVDREIDIPYGIPNHPNTRSRRIIAAIFRLSVKGGADDLACPATVALIKIDLDCLNFLLNLAHFILSLSVLSLR